MFGYVVWSSDGLVITRVSSSIENLSSNSEMSTAARKCRS